MEKGFCQTCVFFEPIPGAGNQGECHYSPPVPEKGFAITATSSWCSRLRGEWDILDVKGSTEKKK